MPTHLSDDGRPPRRRLGPALLTTVLAFSAVATALAAPGSAAASGVSTQSPRGYASGGHEDAGPSEPTQPTAGDGPNVPRKQPNILLITTDDQTVADLEYMPHTKELIGAAGTTFTDVVSPYPLCCPARATILTGQLSHNHGVLTNHAPKGGFEAFQRHEHYGGLLPAWLQDVGYHTMFAGKYLNGHGKGDYKYDVPPSWDEWNGTIAPGVYDYEDFDILDEQGTVTRHEDDYQTDVLGEITRDRIRAAAEHDRPFFIWESNLAPHAGCDTDTGCKYFGPPEPAPEDAAKFDDLTLSDSRHGAFNERVVHDKPSHVHAEPRWRAAKLRHMTASLRGRIRSLQAVDRSVAETVAVLAETGQLDDTLVIFTSDNGYLLGEHRWHGKVLPYEPSLRIPMLVRWPSATTAPQAGTVVDETVALVDVAPTIAEAAGATPSFEPDGRPLQRVLEDPAAGYGALSIEAGPLKPEDTYWFYRGVRTGRYTYVRYPETREVELYDRVRDPDQQTNVAYRPAYARVRAALQAKLNLLRECKGSACYGVPGDEDVPQPEPEPLLTTGTTVHPDDLASSGAANRLATVTAPDWSSGRGRLTAWRREGRTWRVVAGPFPVQLGARGMVAPSRRRQETGETPAGAYGVHVTFGLRARPATTALPYRRLGRTDEWVYDPRVPSAYNLNQPLLERTRQTLRPPRPSWRRDFALRWSRHAARFPRALLLRYNLPTRVRRFPTMPRLRSGRPADVRKGSLVVHVGPRLGRHGWMSASAPRVSWLTSWLRRDSKILVGTAAYLRNNL